MSILETLFLRKDSPADSDTTFALTDLVLDWFKASNLDLKTFEAEHLGAMIGAVQQNQYIKENFEKDPGAYAHTYFDGFAIPYLAFHSPDNAFFKNVLNVILAKNTGRHIYRVKEIVTSTSDWDWGKNARPEFEIHDAGRRILSAYHAIHMRVDANYSYIQKVASSLGEAKYAENQSCFDRLLTYISGQLFREKTYVLVETMRRQRYSYENEHVINFESQNELLKKALTVAIAQYNSSNDLPLDEGILMSFSRFLSYNETGIWKSTDYKKRRFLKVKDFEVCERFVASARGNELQVLQNAVYYMGSLYIGSDEQRLFADALTQIRGNLNFPVTWITGLMAMPHLQSDKFFMDVIFIPLLIRQKGELTYDNPMVATLEKRVFANPVAYSDAFPALREIAGKIGPGDERALYLSRLSPYFAQLSHSPYSGFMPTLQMDSSDKKFPVVKSMIDDLNVILPVALKGVEKTHYYVDEPRPFFKLNLKNQDIAINSEFVIAINDLLFNENTGYQLLPVPVLKLPKRDAQQSEEYMTSLAYVSANELRYITEHYIKKYFPDILTQGLLNKIRFAKLDGIPFRQLKGGEEAKKESGATSNAFLEDINWAWFKDKYIDQLKSNNQWYLIMDLIVQCSSGKKPNAKWLAEVSSRIALMGHENYHRELQVLLNDSLKEEFWYFDTYRNALKGFIWTCTHLHPTDESLNIVKTITEAAYTKVPNVGPKSAALGNAALDALVESGKEEAFGLITVMLNKTRYNRFSDVLEKYIDKFKATSDVPEELLADRSIPRFGLEHGEKTMNVGTFQVKLQLADGKLKKTWLDAEARELKAAPASLDAKLVKEITEESKQINQVFTDLKKRLRLYWLHNRTWKGEHWISYVLGHPLMYPHIEGQVWRNVSKKVDFIVHMGQLITVDGIEHQPDPADEIVFWHPVVAGEKNVEQWQEYMWSNKIVQHERQVFREHYPFSAKELGDKQTQRFGHHFLEVKKLMAIAPAAGWIFTYVHEGANWPRLYIKPLDITAHLACDYDRFDFAIPTKELYFTKGDTTKINDYRTLPERMAIADVPLVTLSEVCRDIDLFIAVTSVSNNPELSSNRQEMDHYRMQYEKGLFSDNATSKVRRRIIEKLSPALNVRSSGFDGNYWIVQGKLNEYRINLGSGFAQIRESQKHLNILPDVKKVRANKKIQLPVEDDDTLYIILAKALFLQDDDKVVDEKLKALLH